ncbi:hypothetical protein SLS62_002631 [Diatrype stigma]|uniref:Uncharacterized protein n=1 Tax=Diatrype stigma TaxID=117547 RepID=A0AAN9YV20_9PEZI
MASQQDQKVQLSLSLSTSAPHSISIHDAYPETPLKLLATITQIASPFPSRAVTILTKYSCLDTSPGGDDAFFIRAMASPTNTNQADGTPRELPLWPIGRRITTIRVSGDPDLRKRPADDGFVFLTVPPVGAGSTEVVLSELAPARLVRRLPSLDGGEEEDVRDKLRRLLRPGDAYRIAPSDLGIRWWAFGSLSQELRDKKIARWSLPDDLPLVRGPGEDETEDVARRLQDLVDLHDVNYLSSRSAVEGEERPVVARMRAEGWVFGEPPTGLELVCAEGKGEAVFEIVE